MDSLKYLNQFEDIISADAEIKEFCTDKLHWIHSRKRDWEMDKIRVGVIGVTSSGKSTLINAILGVDILSSAIAPSSGQLVSCAYGEELLACIRFEDGSIKVLKGDKFSKKQLEQYSDERYNPKNHKGVVSIELQSPYYEIGQDVVLIDSPGLDAYGLKEHERITMEILVPTVDVCVYVTTMKTNSDQKTREILDTVARYQCPLLIVQNMLDAIRPPVDGRKTTTQIAKEHYERVERIIAQSKVRNKKHVKIVQISAKRAMTWRANQYGSKTIAITEKGVIVTKTQFDESNYDKLIRMLQVFLRKQKPRIEIQRIKSIFNTISELQKELEEKCSGHVGNIETETQLIKAMRKLDSYKETQEHFYEELLGKYETKAKELIGSIGSSMNEANADTYGEKTNHFVKEMGDAFQKLIQANVDYVKVMAEELNIPVRDLLKHPSLNFYKSISLEKEAKKIETKEKDRGFLASLKRGLGWLFGNDDWGYHTETEEVLVINLEASKRKLEQRIKESFVKYTEVYEEWKNMNLVVAVRQIEKELQFREEVYLAKRNVILQQEKMKRTCDNLELVKAEIKIKYSNTGFLGEEEEAGEEGILVTQNQLKEVDAPDYSAGILLLSKIVLKQQHHAMMKQLVKIAGAEQHRAVVLGWDENCLKDFAWQSGITDTIEVNLTQSSSIMYDKNLPTCFFILVNAIQFGAAKNQIATLSIWKNIKPEDMICWVVQDFGELINSGCLVEGLSNMLILNDIFKVGKKSSIWLVHENPIYNLAFLTHQFEPVKSINEENQLLERLRKEYFVYCDETVIKNISDIIRNVHIQKG